MKDFFQKIVLYSQPSSFNYMKGVNIFLAGGFETVEALAPCDVLRRGGIDVRMTALERDTAVVSAQDMAIVPDGYLDELETGHQGTSAGDFMIFPGGMPGARKLADCAELISLMRGHYAAGGSLAAICAAPGLVLSQLEDVKSLEFTCYDGFQDALLERGAAYRPQGVVCCGRIITGRGPGYALDFGLEILAAISGAAAAAAVREGMFLE